MSRNTSFTQAGSTSRLVGVVNSRAALARAIRLRRPPDFFELRLDLLRRSLDEVEQALPRLRAPLILTARHPAEGGDGQLKTLTRQSLILRFLGHAALVDIELRSLRQMQPLLAEMHRRRVGLLLSLHQLTDTPSVAALQRLANSARAFHPAILKIATRTDTVPQLDRLLAFFREKKEPPSRLAIMGIGKLGRKSRIRFDRLGSALTYVSLGDSKVEGQPSLEQLRRSRRAYIS